MKGVSCSNALRLVLVLWALLSGYHLVSYLQSTSGGIATQAAISDALMASDMVSLDACAGKHLYIYEDLVAPYNEEILLGCSKLGGHSMCNALLNEGRGEPDSQLCRREDLNQAELEEGSAAADFKAGLGNAPNCSWFRTNQFSLEVLIHHRLRRHPCRVGDPSEAKLFYVPFYTGLEIKRSWGNQAAAVDRFNLVLNPLVNSPHFQKRRGLDHFMAFGRMGMEFGFFHGFVTWLGNVTKLMIEVGWNQEGFRMGREISVPYPTGFHPAELADVNRHRSAVRGAARDTLVSYAGAVGRCVVNAEFLSFLEVLRQSLIYKP